MRALVYEGIDLGGDDTSLIADFLEHNIVPHGPGHGGRAGGAPRLVWNRDAGWHRPDAGAAARDRIRSRTASGPRLESAVVTAALSARIG
jgi:hypothetical protein